MSNAAMSMYTRIETERLLFEADAKNLGFDITRHHSPAPEPWAEYDDYATGHRWAGWKAARGLPE